MFIEVISLVGLFVTATLQYFEIFSLALNVNMYKSSNKLGEKNATVQKIVDALS